MGHYGALSKIAKNIKNHKNDEKQQGGALWGTMGHYQK